MNVAELIPDDLNDEERTELARILRTLAELPAPTGLDRLIRRDLLAAAQLVG